MGEAAASVVVLGEETRRWSATEQARPELVVLVDFKSGGALLACGRTSPLPELARDLSPAARLRVLPFDGARAEEVEPGADAGGDAEARPQSLEARKRAYKARDVLRALELAEVPHRLSSRALPLRGNRALLVGLLWADAHLPGEVALEYCFRAFEAFHDAAWLERLGGAGPAARLAPAHALELAAAAGAVCTLLREACVSCGRPAALAPEPVGLLALASRLPTGPVRAEVPHSERKPFGVPCFVLPDGTMSYQLLSYSLVRHRLAQLGLLRLGAPVDVTCAWRPGAGAVRADALGMPGSSARVLSRPHYRANSADASAQRSARAVVRCFIDIKSPHAYLALEQVAMLEEDFDVYVDWLPFDLDLARVYGEEKAALRKGAGSAVPPPVSFSSEADRAVSRPRTAPQINLIKWTYADLRRYATLRGITLFGTEKVWDSVLVLKAMLFCKAAGRACLDRFLAEQGFPKLWRRELSLEDAEHVRALCAAAGAPVQHFDRVVLAPDGAAGRALERELAAASAAGVFGVPSILLADGQLFWGKEHLSAVRLQLLHCGFARRRDVPVDVPYLWRPAQPAAAL
jgi:2-hydroxychromene-2-carboxylate isomerase